MVRRRRPPGKVSAESPPHRNPSAWLPGFLAWLEAECGMAANTIAAYRRDCVRFFDWNAKSAKASLSEIGVQTLSDWLASQTDQGYAAASMARGLVAIRMFFRYLMLEGVVAESTVDLVSSPRLWQRLPQVLSPELVDELLTTPRPPYDRYYRRDRAILAVMYATGCRVSEVTGLKLSDVRLDERYCRCLGKGSKERLVSLNPIAVDAIRDYLATERPALAAVGSAQSENLFLTRSGRAMNRESLWAMVQRYAARAGCGGAVSPHTLRHSFATHMLAGGAEIRALQEMLGHASIRTTQIYTHVDHSRLKAVHRSCHPRG